MKNTQKLIAFIIEGSPIIFNFGCLKLVMYFPNENLKKISLWKWRKKNLAVTIEIHLFCLLLANKAGILKLEPCLPICVSYMCNLIVVPRVYCFALFSIVRLWALGSCIQQHKPVICLLLSSSIQIFSAKSQLSNLWSKLVRQSSSNFHVLYTRHYNPLLNFLAYYINCL